MAEVPPCLELSWEGYDSDSWLDSDFELRSLMEISVTFSGTLLVSVWVSKPNGGARWFKTDFRGTTFDFKPDIVSSLFLTLELVNELRVETFFSRMDLCLSGICGRP